MPLVFYYTFCSLFYILLIGGNVHYYSIPSWAKRIRNSDCRLNGKQMYSGTIQKDVTFDVSNYTPVMYLGTIENKETKTHTHL